MSDERREPPTPGQIAALAAFVAMALAAVFVLHYLATGNVSG